MFEVVEVELVGGFVVVEGVEVGEVGSGAEADVERKVEGGFGEVEGLGGPVLWGVVEEGGEVKNVGVEVIVFKVGNEGVDEGGGFLEGGFLGRGVWVEEEEFG